MAAKSWSDVYGDPSTYGQSLNTEGGMLPEGFRDIQIWRDYADALDEVYGFNYGGLLRDLLGIRDSKYITTMNSIDRATLLKINNQIGLRHQQNDIFSIQDLRNFAKYTPQFWQEKGTRDFIQYMSFAINAILTMQYLWTQDYVNFSPEGSTDIGTPIYEGGSWYPTSQVFISYDVAKFQSTVNSNFSTIDTLSNFFYTIAPIHLVIKTFRQTVNAPTMPLYIGGAMAVRIWQHQ